MKLNREELIYGFCYVSLFLYWIGYWAIPFALLSSFLWALSGSEYKINHKLFRRLGCPLCIAIPLVITTGKWIVLLGVAPAFGALTLGYGIPSLNPPDEGSLLGRFYNKITGDEFMTNILTRGTIIISSVASFLILVNL